MPGQMVGSGKDLATLGARELAEVSSFLLADRVILVDWFRFYHGGNGMR